MIDGQRVIALIPARAGSKSIPGKNLAPVGGRPLLVRAIDNAKGCSEIDRIIVSTDGTAIADAATAAGAEVLKRPQNLSGDTSPVIDTIRAVQSLLRSQGESAAYMCLLEPTTPLRTSADIQACLRLLHTDSLDSVATFREADLNPNRAWRVENGKPSPYMAEGAPWLPRQQLQPAYQLSGAVYAWRIDTLPQTGLGLVYGRTGAIVVERARSIDIDEPVDLVVVEALLAQMQSK